MSFTSPSTLKNQSEIISFEDFQKEYHKEYLSFFPIAATIAGIEGYNCLFPNSLSDEYRENLHFFYSKYNKCLSRYNYSMLSETEKMTYNVLKWECDMGILGLKFETHLTPIDQMFSINFTFGQFASGVSAQPFKTVEDYNNWLKRIDGFIEWTHAAIENMRKGIAQGYVLPASLIRKVIPQWESLSGGSVFDHLFFGPAKIFPANFSEVEKLLLSEAFYNMVSEKIMPLYSMMAEFLKEEYLPNGRQTSGVHALPFGVAFYQYRIKYYTTTNLTADQIIDLGKSEVKRIREEMEKVKDCLGYTGDLKSFFDYVRYKKELIPFDNPDQVIGSFNSIYDRMKAKLPDFFDLSPKAAFEVRRTEAFREASASAEYASPSNDGSRPGIFYVPVPDVSNYNTFSDESLFLHEAIPGHHYQISLQQENDLLPDFRKTLWYSSFGEGWALYCESLGKELGLYQDPFQYFGMLSAEMHRSIRLVVDPSIHTKGWTREEAIQYSLNNEARSEESIVAEIERYMAMPGQALSYKIGQLKIQELKEKAIMILGNQFSIREFHNMLLSYGCIPLNLLEGEVNHWIADKTSFQ